MAAARRGILALDVARQMGWAMTHPDRVAPLLGTVALKAPIGHDYGPLYGSLYTKVVDLVCTLQPAMVWFEAPLFIAKRSMQTARQLMGLAAIVELVAWQAGVPCREGNVNEVRRHVIGTRSRSDPRDAKEIALDYCRLRKWEAPDDNAADAAVLWVYGYAAAGAREGS